MLRWFHALMPKEERFFDLFARHSEAVLAGAVALRAMLEGGAAVERNYQIVTEFISVLTAPHPLLDYAQDTATV